MELPGKGLVRALDVSAPASGAAAAAPWSALGGVGQEIGQAGNRLSNLLVKHKELETRRRAADMELEFDQLAQGYQQHVLENPNLTPDQAMEGWNQTVSGFQKKYQGDGMSPMERDMLGTRAADLVSKGGYGVARAAFARNIENTRQSAKNLIVRGEAQGDEEMRARGFDMLRDVVPDANIEAERMNSDRRVMTAAVERQIQDDPRGMRSVLDDPDFVKNHPGVSVDDVPRLREVARAAERRDMGDQVDQFSDAVATGAVKTPDDVDRVFGQRVPPRIVEKMKGQLAERSSEAERVRLQSPAVQNQLVGEASRLVSGLSAADADGFEEGYSTAAFMIDRMTDSPIKRRLKDQLAAAKTGRQAEVKTRADAAMKALEDFDKREEGKLPKAQKFTTKQITDAGFLRDKDKMIRLGFDEATAKSIVSAAKDSPDAAIRLLRDNWDKKVEGVSVRAGSVTANPFDVASANALRLDHPTIDWNDPESESVAAAAQEEFDRASGDRKTKLAAWLNMNPDAKPADIDAKVWEIGGEGAQKEMVDELMELESGPKGASDATSALPQGDNLRDVVKHFEAGGAKDGFHRSAYWDAKQWSIGYGTRSKKGEVIDEAEAGRRLDQELSEARTQVRNSGRAAGLKLSPQEEDALTSFHYNTGSISNLLKGGARSKQEIADAMLLYNTSEGKRLTGLDRRRAAERKIFLQGYPVRN